jgi:hypothetical protein
MRVLSEHEFAVVGEWLKLTLEEMCGEYVNEEHRQSCIARVEDVLRKTGDVAELMKDDCGIQSKEQAKILRCVDFGASR